MLKIYGILFHAAVFLTVCSGLSTECLGSLREDDEPVPTEYLKKYSKTGSFTETFSRYYGNLVPPPTRRSRTFSSSEAIIQSNQDFEESSLLFMPFCTNKERYEAVQEVWNDYHKWFDYHVMYDVKQKISQIGIQELTLEQLYSIRDYLNPNIGSPQHEGIITRHTSLNIGQNIIKFSLKTALGESDVPNWTCYSYVVQAKIELEMSIYEHL